jgi:hypothetical protein
MLPRGWIPLGYTAETPSKHGPKIPHIHASSHEGRGNKSKSDLNKHKRVVASVDDGILVEDWV